MNDDVSPAFALALGCVIGALLYGPVKRWILTLTRTLRARAARGERRAAGSSALLLIFATLHPAPWLLLAGLPYAVYRLWSDPLRVIWASLLAGMLLSALLALLYAAAGRMRGRRVARGRGQ